MSELWNNSYFINLERNGPEIARLIYQWGVLLQAQVEIFPDELQPAFVSHFLDAYYGPGNWGKAHEQMLRTFHRGRYPQAIDLSTVTRVLDIGCGPGAWALSVVAAYPDICVIGIDSDATMVNHATLLAEAEGKEQQVRFLQMDALGQLNFSDGCFDLVNGNAVQSFLRPGDWPGFLREIRRVLRPGGYLKLSELEVGVTTSRAVEETYLLWAATMKVAGRSFSPDGRHLGLTAVLKHLLQAAAFSSVSHKAYGLDSSFGAEGHQGFLEDMVMLQRHLGPFIRAYQGQEAFERQKRLIDQTLIDIADPEFRGIAYNLSVWGQNPHASQEER